MLTYKFVAFIHSKTFNKQFKKEIEMHSAEELQKQIEEKINRLQLEEVFFDITLSIILVLNYLLQKVLEKEVSNLMGQKIYIDGKIAGLSKVIPTLKLIEHQAVDLVDTINGISKSSETISDKIRSLDMARVSVHNSNPVK